MASKKKILSAACAAAMILSAFSGMSVVSHAEAAPVFEYTDGSTTDWSGSTTLTQKYDADDPDFADDAYLLISKGNNSTEYALPEAAQLTDNYVIDFDTKIRTGNGMGRLDQFMQIAFVGDSSAKDARDFYNTTFIEAASAVNPDSEHGWNTGNNNGMSPIGSDIAVAVNSRIELLGKWEINHLNSDGQTVPTMEDGDVQIDDVTVGEDGKPTDWKYKWVRVRAEVSGGKAKVTVIDSLNNKYLDAQEFDADATKLTKIFASVGRTDTTNFIPVENADIALDNVKIYDVSSEAAPALTTDGLRGEHIVVKPAAPETSIPDGATQLTTNDFNELNKGMIIGLTNSQDYDTTTISGLGLGFAGTRDESTGTNWSISVLNDGDTDKYLEANTGRFASGGRQPVLKFMDNVELADGQVFGVTFVAKNIISDSAAEPAKLAFVDGLTTLLTATTDETAESGEGVLVVKNDTWVTYDVEIKSDNTCTIKADGNVVYTGSVSSITLPTLQAPAVAEHSYNKIAIDNLKVYTTGTSVKPVEILAPDVTAPEGAKTIPTVDFNSEESTKTILTLNAEEKDLYTDYNGLGLYIGARSEGPGKDYTTWSIAKDYEKDRYLKAYFGEFGGSGRTPTLKFTSEATLTEGQILGAKFAAKIIDGESVKGVMTFTEGVPTEKNYEPLATVSTDSSAENAVAAGEWVIYEITVDANKNCVIKAGEKEIYSGQITGNTLPSVSGSNENTTKTAICFDNIVTYTTGEFTQTVAEPAPEIKAPADSITAFEQNLNSFTSKQTLVTIGKEASVSEAVDGLKVTLAGRSDGAGDGTTYASVEKFADNDYVLQIGAGQYSTGGRSPVIDLADAFKGFELDDGDTTVVEFAAKLSDGKNGNGEIVFLASEDTEVGGGEYRHVAGKITTGAEDENVVVSEANKNTNAYTYGVGTVQADKWIKVKVEVTKQLGRISEGEVLYPINIYVNDTLVSSSENGRYRYGEDSIATLEGLPKIAFLDSKSGDNYPAPYSTIQLDNFVAYKKVKAAPTDVSMSLSNGGQKVNVKSDASTGTALLVRARYDENGAMTNVKLNTVSLGDGKTATISFDDAQTGDKYILLNGINNLTPLSEAATASIKEAAE